MSLPTFPILYKNNHKGSRTKWHIEIRPTTTENVGAFDVVVSYGEEFGVAMSHISTVREGKAKRTVLEQAISVAKSKWTEKTQRDTYQPERADGIQNHLNQTTVVRPMLAQTYEPTKIVKKGAYVMPFPCLVQRKYDGIRCICHLDPVSGEVILESRKGVAFQNFDALKRQILSTLYQFEHQKTMYYDGELYTKDLVFETISGLVRLTKAKTKPADLAKLDLIQYHVYDLYDPTHPEWTFEERNRNLLSAQQSLRDVPSLIQRVPTDTVHNIDDVRRFHAQYVLEGFEGIMLRDPSGKYESDKRSKYLQKYKEFLEEEFLIVGYHDGEGIDRGLVIWECITQAGVRFSARPRGTHEYRRELFLHAGEHIGKKLTVVFQEYSADGSPRFPVGKAFRGDHVE